MTNSSMITLTPPVREPNWRMGFIGGSDAVKIMQGDWYALWMQKTGIGQPDDLSNQFNVQLGTYTEDFNLAWFERSYGVEVLAWQPEYKKTIQGIPFKATLDGVIPDPESLDKDRYIGVECKHTSSFKKFDDILLYYSPQIQLYMKVANISHMYLSVIFGNQWECKLVSQDDAEWLRMLPILKDFWRHVVQKKPPKAQMPNEMPDNVSLFTLDGLVTRDASQDNHFRMLEDLYIQDFTKAKEFDGIKKEIKSLIKPNEREVYTDRLSIKKNKRGALTISIKEEINE